MSTANPMILAAVLAITPMLSQAVEVGAPLPSCNLTKLSDDSVLKLAQPGKVIYVDFWASWCAPCAQAMPFLNEIHKQFQDQNFEVIAINLDENRQDAEAFLKKHPVKFTIAANSDGQCPSLFGVQAMPSSYLIDRQGKIRYVQLGFHHSESAEIRQRVQSLLAEK